MKFTNRSFPFRSKMLAADAFSAVHEASSNSDKGQKIYELDEVKKITQRYSANKKLFNVMGSHLS